MIALPPAQNQDAERSVLGGILLDNTLLGDIAFLEPRHWFVERNRKVYEAMLALDSKGQPIDRVTLKGELVARGLFGAVGGDACIDALDQAVPSAANLAYYGGLIVDAALHREILSASLATAAEAREQRGGAIALLDAAEERLSGLRSPGRASATKGIVEAMRDAYCRIKQAYEGTGPKGLTTGIAHLDEETTGWHPGELIILAARPSAGKTAAALNWALHAALNCSVTVAIFELEMPAHEVVNRLLASHGRVSLQGIRSGRLGENDWPKLAYSSGMIGGLGIEIDDTPSISVMELRGKCRRIARKCRSDRPLGLVVVDYIQLMRGNERIDSREQQVSEVALQLKHLAGELGVPVLALSQLNRASEKRPDGRPKLSDLRESGALEQHADAVVFVHRPWIHDGASPKDEAEFIVGKQRNGPIGTTPVIFDGEHVTFRGMETDRREYLAHFSEREAP